MRARRLTPIMSAMTLAKPLETTQIPRIAGRTGDHNAVVTTLQCRARHNPISDVGPIGWSH